MNSQPFALRSLAAKIPRWLLAVIVGLAPPGVTFWLIKHYLHSSLHRFSLASWNDQAYYWHQILTFSYAGFKGGYYTVYENPPALDFFHFGASGFLFPAVYGTMARVVGWETYTGILLNMAVMALAVWITIYVMDFDRVQILTAGLLLLTVGPILMYMPTISQESLHQAAALLFAAIFYRLSRRSEERPGWWPIVVLGFFTVVSLMRFSWILLIFPYLVLSQKKWSARRFIITLFGGVVFAFVILSLFQRTSAPGNNVIFTRMSSIVSSPLAALENFSNAILANLEEMLTIFNIHLFKIETVQVIQFFILVIGLFVGGVLLRDRRTFPASQKELWFHLYNLTAILAASLIFYVGGGYYRVLAPHLLLTGMLLIASRNFWPVSITIAIGLMTFGTFLTGYHQWSANFAPSTQPERIQESLEPYLEYDTHTTNAWCNTLLMPVWLLDNRVTLVPAGIGITFFLDATLQPAPIRSKYLLLDNPSYEGLRHHLNVDLLTSTPFGSLYRNRDVDCSE